VPLSAVAEFEPKACAASWLPVVVVRLGTESCAAVPLPAVGAAFEPKACAVSLRLTVVVTVGPEICPVVLPSEEVMVLATVVCAVPIVPHTVIRPERCESGCVAVTVAPGAPKSVPEAGEAGASFG
jgi:hypothetical protein